MCYVKSRGNVGISPAVLQDTIEASIRLAPALHARVEYTNAECERRSGVGGASASSAPSKSVDGATAARLSARRPDASTAGAAGAGAASFSLESGLGSSAFAEVGSQMIGAVNRTTSTAASSLKPSVATALTTTAAAAHATAASVASVSNR